MPTAPLDGPDGSGIVWRTVSRLWLALALGAIGVSCRSAPHAAPPAPLRPAEEVSLDGEWLLEGLPPDADASPLAHVPQDPIPAPVPGTVQAALLAAGRITDPYVAMHNETSQWVRDRAWWYRRGFAVPERFRGKTVRLGLEGVACASTIWLNGQKIGETTGMHARAAFDVSSALRHEGANLLVIRIPPPPADRLLGDVCQMSFGWDFAPRIVPIGIWRSVSLTACDSRWIESPAVETDGVGTDGAADLTLRVELINTDAEPRAVTLRGEVDGAPARFAKQFDLPPHAVQDAVVAFRLPEARLWWPNGLGEPNLYRLDLTLEPQAQASAPPTAPARASTIFGVRRIRLEKNAGAAERDAPWTFVINGRRTHITGANWVPADSLFRPARPRVEILLRLARDAGVKLLRVWGGGILESDDFYDLCDRGGILVWQEFPLVRAENYSGIPRRAFIDNAAGQVLRLRGHPSLALWGGGAELDPDNAFNKDLVDGLAGVVARLDPARPFYRSSPAFGEEHDWDVWDGLQPYTEYRRPAGFRSEAGLQAPPAPANLKRFLPGDQLWPPQEGHAYHGLTTPAGRYANEYGPPRDIADWVRKLQLAQAIGVQFNVEACRARKYANGGVLLWQWNEPWPCVSWSLVDWYGRSKPAYDHFRRACDPVRITADFAATAWPPGATFRADVIVINDRAEALTGLRATADLVDRVGDVLASKTFALGVEADAVARPGSIAWTLPEKAVGVPGRFFFLRLRLTDARGAEISRNVFWHGVSAPPSSGRPTRDPTERRTRRSDLRDAGLKDEGGHPESDGLFAGLSDLEPVVVRSRAVRVPQGGRPHRWSVYLENLSRGPAFEMEVRADGVPEGWMARFSDNALTLWGGEKREILVEVAPLDSAPPDGAQPHVDLRLSGWNLPDQTVAP